MCGIAGSIDRNGVELKDLEKMTDVVAHRGPDASGLWLAPDRSVGLGHRRLSIIDLSSNANQPMFDAQLNISVVFNGEIYNFVEIRKLLEKKGHRFLTSSDTEVLLKAYAEWGLGSLARLEGMFAFGLYDGVNGKVVLARDRVGKKPLYYYADNARFVFGSQVKSLAQHSSFRREIDLDALNAYFAFGYVPGEMSIFKNVRKLAAGSCLTLDIKSLNFTVDRYWELPGQEPFGSQSVDEVANEFESLFLDAVRKRMVADVPYGALLSGGLDSSLVVAAMCHVTDAPVRTFSIGFEEQDHDERVYASKIAEYFKTRHHELIVRAEGLDIMEELTEAFDEPFADPSLIPTHFLMKMVKGEVSVALSGDGGDEVFCGYHAYSRTLIDQRLNSSFFRPIKKIAAMAGRILPDSIPGKQRLLRQTMSAEESFLDRRMTGYFREAARRTLFTADVLTDLGGRFLYPEIGGLLNLKEGREDLVYRLTAADFKSYLVDDILVKVDRASMWNSLEVRCPFLDHRIVEFSFGKVPSEMKFHNSTLKYLLKVMAKKYLPRDFELNRKWGFALPLKKWLRCKEGLEWGARFEKKPNSYISGKNVQRLVAEHITGKADHSNRLFAVMVFDLWKSRWLGD